MVKDYENMEDLQKMQQEAVKRVQEMQKRAKISLEYSNLGINRQKENTKETLPQSEPKNDFNKLILANKERKNENNIKNNSLDALIKDPQKGLILLLILLLYDEKSDLGLILALLYIML